MLVFPRAVVAIIGRERDFIHAIQVAALSADGAMLNTLKDSALLGRPDHLEDSRHEALIFLPSLPLDFRHFHLFPLSNVANHTNW